MSLRRFWAIALISVWVGTLAITAGDAHGAVIISEDTEDCVRSPGAAVDDYECEPVKSVTIPVSHDMEVELALVTIDGQIETAVHIYVTKTVPKIIYPLQFFHTAAFAPYEQVLRPLDGGCTCVDDPDATDPTCGWTFQGSTKIEDSQGFCNRAMRDPANTWWRGKDLTQPPDPGVSGECWESAETGHCLRTGDLMFDGYEIAAYRRTYEIEIRVFEGSYARQTHTFTLTPSEPVWNSTSCPDYPSASLPPIKAELLGDLNDYQGVEDLSNYILYIPRSPTGDPMVLNYPTNMLLVPREEVTRDGSEINKVGVSFEAFRALGATTAYAASGDGLHNQLHHKYMDDIAIVSSGGVDNTRCLVHKRKPFRDSMAFDWNRGIYLEQKLWPINHSLVALQTEPFTSVRTIRSPAAGTILTAEVDDFTSMGVNGTLMVEVQNPGYLEAAYIVTVSDESANIIHGVPARPIIVGPLGTSFPPLYFDVHTAYNVDATNNLWVRLYSLSGELLDEQQVTFVTSKHPETHPWLLKRENEGTQPPDNPWEVIGDLTSDGQVDGTDVAKLGDVWLEDETQDLEELSDITTCWLQGTN